MPHITKSLLFVQILCRDNHVYFEFHASMFYVKDLVTKKALLFSQSNDGLYVLSESFATLVPQAFWSLCISAIANLWHRRLGHLTPCILNLLVSCNKIICTSRRFLTQYQACPLSRSSRLSLRPTGHKTSFPLDLILVMFGDTTKRLMSSPKCRSVEVINNPARPGSNHREVNCINYK